MTVDRTFVQAASAMKHIRFLPLSAFPIFALSILSLLSSLGLVRFASESIAFSNKQESQVATVLGQEDNRRTTYSTAGHNVTADVTAANISRHIAPFASPENVPRNQSQNKNESGGGVLVVLEDGELNVTAGMTAANISRHTTPLASSENPWTPPHPSPRRYFVPRNQSQNKNESGGELLVVLENGEQPTHRQTKPWRQIELVPLNYTSIHSSADVAKQTASLIRSTMVVRLDFSRANNLPQWPQLDQSTAEHVALKSNIIGVETLECYESHKGRDCVYLHPTPKATLVTAYYQFASKHKVIEYKQWADELLHTSDPMIIFVEPGSEWEEFFTKKRTHAPTLIVPRRLEDLVLGTTFPPSFWTWQHSIDPERNAAHNNTDPNLYVVWNEKMVLLQAASMLNPFNTTQFFWVDAGYCRVRYPQLHHKPVVRVNVTSEGVDPHAVLMVQMKILPMAKRKGVLVGGNSFGGTYEGIDNLYSSFYETLWQMTSEQRPKFVGSDQKVMYRMCKVYPSACHIHKPKKLRSWFAMLQLILPGRNHTLQPDNYMPIWRTLGGLDYGTPPDPLPEPPRNGVFVKKNVTR